jgi:hypothetical protein
MTTTTTASATTHRVVVVTFAGRRCYLEILFAYIRKYTHLIDEFRLYVATENADDIRCMEDFQTENPAIVRMVCPDTGSGPFNMANVWNAAYQDMMEPGTVYIKLDDDIVYLDENLFTGFVKHRLENRGPILLYPMIVNNTIGSWLLQKRGLYSRLRHTYIGDRWPDVYQRIAPTIKNSEHNEHALRIGDVVPKDDILCPIAWGNREFCDGVHAEFLRDAASGDLSRYLGSDIILNNCEPMSINACSWIGDDLAEVVRTVGNVFSDEPWLSMYAPTWTGRRNKVYGGCVVSHYAYYRQRELGVDALDGYRRLAGL